jgi:AAA domain/DnaB-like helicase N terminal domain
MAKRLTKQSGTPDLPHDLALERDVLAAALEFERLAPGLTRRHFFREAHRIVWSAIQQAVAQGLSPGYPVVRTLLEERKLLDEVGGSYLQSIVQNALIPRDSWLASAVEHLEDLARRRDDVTLVLRAAADPHSINGDKLIAALTELRTQRCGPTGLLDDVAILEAPDPAFLIAKRIPSKSLFMLFGETGIGKTFVSIDLSLCVASGRPWLGAAIDTRGSVIYISAEGSPRNRIGGWKMAHGFSLAEPLGLYTWPNAVPLLDDAEVSKFIALIRPKRPVCVIVDTLARCLIGADENSARDIGLAITNADRIKTELSTAVGFVHHTTKNGAGERGSGALRAACDTVLQLTKTDDLLQLSCSKQKDSELFEPLDLKLVPAYEGSSTCVVRLASDVVTDREVLTDAQGKALHVMTEVFGAQGATASEWQESLQTISKATFYRARRVLLDAGYVREKGKRFYPTDKSVSRGLTPSRTDDLLSSQLVSDGVA